MEPFDSDCTVTVKQALAIHVYNNNNNHSSLVSAKGQVKQKSFELSFEDYQKGNSKNCLRWRVPDSCCSIMKTKTGKSVNRKKLKTFLSHKGP